MAHDDLTRIPVTAELLRGAVEIETTDDGVRPHRLPAWVRRQLPDPQLLMVEAQPSGVRLAIRTEATHLELVTRPTKRVYTGMPARPDGVYDLMVDGRLVAQGTAPEGDVLTLDLATGSAEHTPGSTSTVVFADLPAGAKEVEVWLPHDETTELVELRGNASVEPAPSSGRRTWLHHGSSISHGSNATHPTGTWPAVAAGLAGVDLVNLGLGGSAMLDPATARVMRDLPADLISIKVGINLVNADVMRMRAFTAAVHGFLDTVRDGHPTTPLLVVGPIYCGIHEETPGPLMPDMRAYAEGRLEFVATGNPDEVAAGKLTLRTIREELARSVAQRSPEDPHLHLLDGRALYDEPDTAALPLPDRLHPDGDTHRLMGERFAETVFGPAGAFATDHG